MIRHTDIWTCGRGLTSSIVTLLPPQDPPATWSLGRTANDATEGIERAPPSTVRNDGGLVSRSALARYAQEPHPNFTGLDTID